MIRRIYTTIISFAFAILTFTSCSDWLELYPADEIKEEYLFSSGDGFRTALNGIYRKMSTFNLYGSNLTWGIIDAWGQSYYLDQTSDNGGGKAMKKIAAFNFKNAELVPTTDAMWNAAWNVVANCNNLAQQAVVADSMLFNGRERERQMILSEAIGIRAMMQFDLLRIYAPAPITMGFKDDKRTFIPYVDTYPSYVNDHQTVMYCLEKIVNDLKKAQLILQEVDKVSEMGVNDRFSSKGTGETLFLNFRGYRLNYYAVTAELARVYLYAGKNKEAYTEAKKIIDVNKEKRYFRASTSKYDIEGGNVKMYNDIIFALYSPTELLDWDYEINHSTDGSSEEYYLCIHKNIASEIYGEDLNKDWRAKYQLEAKYYDYYYRPLKYYEQPAKAKYAEINNQTIPMIRMSEVYYIAAEAIFDSNSDEAHEYLKEVKKGRGLSFNKPGISKEEFMNILVNDARREFLGEGQILYLYKRLNIPIKTGDPYYGEDLMPVDTYAVLPMPDSEMNIK